MQKVLSALLAGTVILGTAPALAEQSTIADQKDLSVTIYNDNLGLVREVRALKLEKGARELQFADVAAQIDPTSVSLRSLTAPQDLQVLEQNYEYDLLTPHKLLEKYIGQEVEIHTGNAISKATLLSTNEGAVYRIGDKIYMQAPGAVVLPKVPDNLIARPTLKWMLQNDRSAGEQQTEVSYLTGGMSWKANYVVVVNDKQTQSNLNGWVTLNNHSGATYQNARLTLVAGDVNRVREQPQYRYDELRAMKSAPAAADQQFAERALFEYHSYQLNRPTTLKDNQTKQLSLLSAADIPTKKVFRFEAGAGFPIWYQNSERKSQKVDVYLEMMNSKKDKLGMPLPKGTIRVYQQDQDKRLQFIGEDAIDHTPRDEKVQVKMGQAFDLVGERRQTSYKVLGDRLVESSYEVSLRNHKNEPVTITTVEHMGGDWEMVKNSHAFTKTNATTVEFAVKVPAHKEEKVTFTVRTRY